MNPFVSPVTVKSDPLIVSPLPELIVILSPVLAEITSFEPETVRFDAAAIVTVSIEPLSVIRELASSPTLTFEPLTTSFGPVRPLPPTLSPVPLAAWTVTPEPVIASPVPELIVDPVARRGGNRVVRADSTSLVERFALAHRLGRTRCNVSSFGHARLLLWAASGRRASRYLRDGLQGGAGTDDGRYCCPGSEPKKKPLVPWVPHDPTSVKWLASNPPSEYQRS